MNTTDPALTTLEGHATRLIVGLEIHVELATRSKMFSPAPNLAHPDYQDAEPNTLTDPIVLGMPGTLPVVNRQAVEMAMQVGLALGCRISRRTKWDRKSYFYPDLPKNYQISQYDMPLCGEGAFEVPADETGEAFTVRITRAHLEEDAGKLLHEAPGGRPIDGSIVDLNRAGTPLLEIVTEPDFATAEQVVRFARTLREICRHLGVSGGDMQRGHMRFEPNINLAIERDGAWVRTPIVEIKNLNSFRSLGAAVRYEHRRQLEAFLENGREGAPGSKTTRGWDQASETTFAQREKEEASDYRYFPDPDLVPVAIDEAWIERVRRRLVELPAARRARYEAEWGLTHEQAGAIVAEPGLLARFEAVVAEGAEPRRAATLLLNYGAQQANERGVALHELAITPGQVAGIARLLAEEAIASNGAAELFALCCEPAHAGASVDALAEQHQLLQLSDTGAIEAVVDAVLADPAHAKAVEEIRGGKLKAIGALIGQVMKRSGGQANPKLARELIQKKLGAQAS